MLEATTSGSAPVSSRTINVEANLLLEWLSESRRVRERAARLFLYLLSVLLAACVTCPLLYTALRSAQDRSGAAKGVLAIASAELEALDEERERLQPRMDESAMRKRLRDNAHAFLAHPILVMNAAPPEIAFQTIRITVVSGTLTIHCSADSETYQAAQAFAESAGKGPNLQSSLLSTVRRNDRLAPDGVGFDYVKEVKVGS
jgi:hypothetical protein